MTERFKRRMLNRLKRGLGDETFGDPNENAYVKSDQEIKSQNRSRAAEPSAVETNAKAPAPVAKAPVTKTPFVPEEPIGEIVTTAALGEEDTGFRGGTITTMAIGEEDGSLPPKALDPVFTTMAVGEEDEGGGMRPITPTPPRPNPFLPPFTPFDPPDLPPVAPPVATTMAVGEEDGGMMPPPTEDPRTYGEIPPTIQPVGRTYGNTNPFTGETMFNQMYQPVAVDASQVFDPLREGLGSFLPGGAGNYANNPFMRRT